MAPGVLWRRFFARLLDLLLIIGLCELALRGLLPYWQLFMASQLVFLVYEAAMLTATATTLAKFCFGLRVEAQAGGRIDWPRSWFRTIGVWIFGRALNIPLASEAAALYWYMALRKGAVSLWDRWGATQIIADEIRPLPTGVLLLSIGTVFLMLNR